MAGGESAVDRFVEGRDVYFVLASKLHLGFNPVPMLYQPAVYSSVACSLNKFSIHPFRSLCKEDDYVRLNRAGLLG
jgi:hypothetical protein